MYDPVQDKVFDAEADTLKCRVGRWALQIIECDNVLHSRSWDWTVCKPNIRISTGCTPNRRKRLSACPIGEFEGLQLKRATYSNELVLDLSGIDAEPGSSELRSRYYEATRKLRESPDVSYAEPNATAQPGKDDK